jgi:filamentous hemagglutinin family protein
VQNVLTRVTNGVPSTIDGTLQLSGAKANLYFMNPAGIVFGPNVNLNLPASFVGTTASSIHLTDLTRSSNIPAAVRLESDFIFNPIGPNDYARINQSGQLEPFQLGFANNATGSIINFGKLSLSGGPNTTLALIGQTVWSPAEIKTSSNLTIGTAIAPNYWEFHLARNSLTAGTFSGPNQTLNIRFPVVDSPDILKDISIPVVSDLITNANQTFTSNAGPGNVAINPGDLFVQNIDAIGSINFNNASSGTRLIAGNLRSDADVSAALYIIPELAFSENQQIQVGNIQARNITLAGTGDLTTGNIRGQAIEVRSIGDIRTSHLNGKTINLTGRDISVSSILAKDGSIFVKPRQYFQVTETIPQSDLGRVGSDLTVIDPTTSTNSAISIAAVQEIEIRQLNNQFQEGGSLEHDANGYVVYRLASNPEIRVEIVAVNPSNGSLVLRNRTTAEIIVGDRVVIRSNSQTPASPGTSTAGLIVRIDPTTGSLVELSGQARPPGTVVFRRGITLVNTVDSNFGNDFTYSTFLKSANPIGGALPGAISTGFGTSEMIPLSEPIQAAITRHQKTLENSPIIPTPTPAPNLTPIVPTPETIPAPEFSEASVLNSTIDPTDTINLSAGAIRGATINPGGLLKIELDTTNPEGILTRKVITK